VREQPPSHDDSTVTVTVQGCVQPATLTLPKGSRLCDLKGKVRLGPNADPRIFKKRRQLKNHEAVYVPVQEKIIAND
jgi:hypothetical protein